MEEIAVLVLQVLLEIVLQLFGGLGFDIASTRSRRGNPDRVDGFSVYSIFALLGGLCGGLSLLIVPRLLIPTFLLRLANLAVAPLVAGGLSYLFSRYLWAAGRKHPQQHFWRAFWFALVFGLARFAYAHR